MESSEIELDLNLVKKLTAARTLRQDFHQPLKNLTQKDFETWFQEWILSVEEDHQPLLKKMSSVNCGEKFSWENRQAMLVMLHKILTGDTQ